MPRDGSGNYSTLPGTHGVADATIESAPYNANVDDVANDLNTPRPVVAGGTGASNPTTARANLGAEVSAPLVTNYDTQVWESGSFKSAAGATGAPTAGDAFVGTAIVYDSNNILLQAFNYSSQVFSYRRKSGGVWGAWTVQPTAADVAGKVAKAGDTMTGALSMGANPINVNVINGASPQFIAASGAMLLRAQAGQSISIADNTNAAVNIAAGGGLTRVYANLQVDGAINAAGAIVAGGALTVGPNQLVQPSSGYIVLKGVADTYIQHGPGNVTHIEGNTTGVGAIAGYVGEILTAQNAGAVAVAPAAWKTLATLALTAGEWDFWADLQGSMGVAGPWNYLIAFCSAADSGSMISSLHGGTAWASGEVYVSGVPRMRLLTGVSQNVYLNIYSHTAAITVPAGDAVTRARRVR
jgi:hypothetical protein